jgi:hypothetical protein
MKPELDSGDCLEGKFLRSAATRASAKGRRFAQPPLRTGATAIAGVVLLLTTFVVQAGPEHLIKQRAKDVANQNNERQGVPSTPPPSTPPAQPAAAPTPARPAGPALSAQATAIRDALGAVIKAGSPTDETTKALQQSMAAAAKGKGKPSEASLAKLARDLAKAVSGTKLSSANQGQLAMQLESLLKTPANAKETETLTTAIHDSLRGVGAGRVDAMVVANDLKVVGLELQQSAAK